MATDRTSLVLRLGEFMSQVSEDCYCAGWLGGTEYLVPELCRRALAGARPQPWGHGVVTPALARTLCDIAEQLGHWVDTDEASVGYVPFRPFPIPPEYIAALDRELESGLGAPHDPGLGEPFHSD
jgi:hypothetical protein